MHRTQLMFFFYILGAPVMIFSVISNVSSNYTKLEVGFLNKISVIKYQ